MPQKSRKLMAAICLALGVSGLATAPASAVALYENINYSGFKFDAPASNNVGLMNDRASSISAAGNWAIYFADVGYRGAYFKTNESFNDLRNMGFGNWNDRISSFHHVNVR